MDISINSVVGIISQYTCISNHLIVYFKYITLLFVNYTSRKLKEKNASKEIKFPLEPGKDRGNKQKIKSVM